MVWCSLLSGLLMQSSETAGPDASLAYELAYGSTPFLRLARESGVARVCDGVGMLVEQAAEGFRLVARGKTGDSRGYC